MKKLDSSESNCMKCGVKIVINEMVCCYIVW